MLRGPFGSYVLAGGAVGEFFPIVAIAVFLGSNGRFLGLLSLVVVAVIALVISMLRHYRPRFRRRSAGNLLSMRVDVRSPGLALAGLIQLQESHGVVVEDVALVGR